MPVGTYIHTRSTRPLYSHNTQQMIVCVSVSGSRAYYKWAYLIENQCLREISGFCCEISSENGRMGWDAIPLQHIYRIHLPLTHTHTKFAAATETIVRHGISRYHTNAHTHWILLHAENIILIAIDWVVAWHSDATWLFSGMFIEICFIPGIDIKCEY